VVFSNKLNELIEKKYPSSRLLYFKDGHKMLNNKEFYRAVRKGFLKDGFSSEALKSKMILN
jgi:hypothetical protein